MEVQLLLDDLPLEVLSSVFEYLGLSVLCLCFPAELYLWLLELIHTEQWHSISKPSYMNRSFLFALRVLFVLGSVLAKLN
jgi:hypothetical protein